MNAQDFQRNFAQSYFGIVPAVLKPILGDTVWNKLDLNSPRALIPATTPNFTTPRCVTCYAILKEGADSYRLTAIALNWLQDLDQDSSVLNTEHPILGMTQHNSTCVFLRRHPMRGYNRGYHPRSCSIVLFNDRLTGSIPTGEHSLVWGIFNPLYYPWDQALDLLDSGQKIGVTLARFLGLFIDEGRRYPRIAFRDEIVGFVQNNQPVVYDYVDQDAKDYIFKVTGKQVKVK